MPRHKPSDTRRGFPADSGGNQCIAVSAVGTTATLRCLERNRRGRWRAVRRLGALRCYMGRNGVTDAKRESDGCTPAGMFKLGFAFGTGPRPQTLLPWRRVTPHSYWVDDPDSPQYNRWVEVPAGGGWSSAERLCDYPREYACAVVVEYNTRERVPGKGSAIFLHCGDRPTSGCVAVGEADLLRILRWLDPRKQPEIFIHTAQ